MHLGRLSSSHILDKEYRCRNKYLTKNMNKNSSRKRHRNKIYFRANLKVLKRSLPQIILRKIIHANSVLVRQKSVTWSKQVLSSYQRPQVHKYLQAVAKLLMTVSQLYHTTGTQLLTQAIKLIQTKISKTIRQTSLHLLQSTPSL